MKIMPGSMTLEVFGGFTLDDDPGRNGVSSARRRAAGALAGALAARSELRAARGR
jgi:hypothetical protein